MKSIAVPFRAMRRRFAQVAVTALGLALAAASGCESDESSGTPAAQPSPDASCESGAGCDSGSVVDGPSESDSDSGNDSCSDCGSCDAMGDCAVEPVTCGVAADWWVAPDGDDTGPGTETAPFATVKKAWSVVEPGQTIVVRGGDYLVDDTLTLSGKSGTDADHRIKLWACAGEVPKFHPTTTTSFNPGADRGISLSGSYLHVKGLEIYGFSQRKANCNKLPAGLHAQNLHDSILERLDIHHNAFGLAISSTTGGVHSSGNLILNSDFHHNSDPWSNTGGSCVMADCPSCFAYGASDGLTIRVSSATTTNTVRGCRMWMNSDDGVDLWSSTGMVVIEGSWAFWNGFRPGADPGAADSFDEGGDGNGYKLGETNAATNEVKRRITGSLAFENKMWGINDNNAKCNAEIYNNTTYANCHLDFDGYCGGYNFSLSPGIPYSLINNISYADVYQGATHAVSLGSGADQTNVHHNSWQVGGVDASDLELSTTGVDGPRQADGSLPALDFLHLRAGSNLIDAGATIPGYSAGCKGPCDLGAYEY